MATWQKGFTQIDNVNGGQEFSVNDYPTIEGFNVPINNTQFLHDNCVGTYQQSFNDEKKAQARNNIGAGTSSFSGAYNDLTGKPTLYQIGVLVNIDSGSGYGAYAGKITISLISTSSSVSSITDMLSKIPTNFNGTGFFYYKNDTDKKYTIVYGKKISNGINLTNSNYGGNSDIATSSMSIESQSYTPIEL